MKEAWRWVLLTLALALLVLWTASVRLGGDRSGPPSSVPVVTQREDVADLLGLEEESVLPPSTSVERVVAAGSGASNVRLSGPGRLVGRVLDRADGRGLAGAEVRLLTIPPAGGEVARQVSRFLGVEADFSRRVAPIATAATNAVGDFRLEGVAEGRWFLAVEAPHHVQETPVSARVLASGSGGPVEIWMRGGGRIVGRVVGPNGEPVAQADVALTTGSLSFLEAAADGELAFLRTVADDRGAFAFHAVAPAEDYEVAAIGRGIAIVHVLDVVVRRGEDTTIELRGEVGATVRGRVVSVPLPGQPLGAPPGASPDEGVPLAGARVAALPRGLRHLKLAKELLVATHAVTGPEGRYELRGLPTGTSDLLAMADAHVPGRGPALHIGSAQDGAATAAPDFALVRGPQLSGVVVDESGAPLEGVRILWSVIDVAMVQGQPSLAPVFAAGMKEFRFPTTGADGAFTAGPFAGRSPFQIRAVKAGYEVGEVEWDPATASRGGAAPGGARLEALRIVLRRGGSVRGTVTDALSGAPVTLFTVSISGRIESDTEGPSRFNPFAQGVEFERIDGSFELADVRPGTQTLRVSAPGYVESSVEVAVGGAAQGTAEDPAESLALQLAPGTVLRGMVQDGEGRPVAGAQVTTERRLARSFERLEAGRQAMETALAVKGKPVQKRPPPVGLLRHLVALGFVSDGVVLSGLDGSFELTSLEPGRAEVLAFHRDYRAGGALVFLQQGEENEPVTIQLTEGAGLRGRVSDRFGQPVAGAMVLAVSPGLSGGPTVNGEFHQARTRGDGTYEMKNLEGGSYLVVATRGDENLSLIGFFGTLNFGLVLVPEDRIVTHDLVDTSASACRVTGVVTRAGVPVTGGVLLAVNLESEGLLGLDLKAAAIEGDGSYAFEGLIESEYEVTFEGEGPRAQFLLDVPDAPGWIHDVALPEGSVVGRVLAAESGEPVAGARLRLLPGGSASSLRAGVNAGGFSGALSRGLARELFGASQRSGIVRTGRDGRFRFQGLEGKAYRLRLEDSRATRDLAPFRDLLVRVEDGAALDLGTLELAPALSIRGRVLDEEGEPVPGAEIAATTDSAAEDAEEGAGGFAARTPVRSDGEGRFRLRGVAPATWRLTAMADGFAGARGVLVEVSSAVEADEVELRLQRGIEVTVLVTDGAGQPRAGVTCSLLPVGESSAAGASGGSSILQGFFTGSSSTDEDGERALGSFAPGGYRLRASQGFQSASREVELRQGGSGRLEIVLE